MTTHPNLILKQIELGPLANFIYFIGDKATNAVAVVDPAWDADELRRQAEKDGYKITAILLTHGHPDHINATDELLLTHDIPVYISGQEAHFYIPKCKNLHKTADHEKISIGNVEIECILTPGHTPGSQCFKYENVLITGDTLFIDGCGRCDLPGGDAKTTYNTLYNIIMQMPDETIIYSGHNYGHSPFTTLGSQKQSNPYLQCGSERDFLEQRMV